MEKKPTREQNPMDIYAQFQYLVEHEIDSKLEQDRKERVFTALNLPVHAHTGTDSVQVNFTDLANVNYFIALQSMTLTSAQIKTLNSSPVVLVPPQGTLTVTIVEGITARLSYGTTAYTGNHNLEFHYTDGNGIQVTDAVPASFINSSSSAFYHAPALSGSFVPIPASTGNAGAIVAFVNTANPASGDSTITLTVKYRLVPFSS